MNSRERIVAAARMEKPDVLPVAPYMGNYGARLADEKLVNYYTDARKLAQAQLAAWRILRQDALVAQSDNYYMAEAFGCRVKYYEDSIPTMEQVILNNPGDVARLKRPNPRNDGRMPVFLEAIQILKQEVGDDVAIRGCGTGPFVMAGHLFGPQNFLLELGKLQMGESTEEQAFLDLFDMICETLIEFAVLQLEAGATIVQCADSLASLDVISPQMYRDLALPYEKKFFKAVNPLCQKHDAVSLLHICGNNAKVFDLYAEVGANIVAVDHKADLSYAKRVMGDRVCLIGNLDPVTVLLHGSPADVERESRLCIQQAAAGGGFILGSGCEVAEESPPDNLHAMIRTAREFHY